MLSMRSIVCLSAAFLGAGAVLAPPRGARAEPPCAPEIQRLCAKVPPGGGRIQGCLKAHESELSHACRSRVDELGREAGVLAASCRWDIGRFCSDVSPGGGHVLACLQGRQDWLTPECKDALSGAGKR